MIQLLHLSPILGLLPCPVTYLQARPQGHYLQLVFLHPPSSRMTILLLSGPPRPRHQSKTQSFHFGELAQYVRVAEALSIYQFPTLIIVDSTWYTNINPSSPSYTVVGSGQ